MLQSFRDNLKGTMAFVIIGIMIVPFALFGVDSLFLQNNANGTAAEVNGEAIAEVDLSRAIRTQKQQLLDRYGEQAPVELLSDENLRQPVLNRLVQREVIEQAAVAGGMTISDAQLDQLIIASPEFQQNGKFSPELYTQLLRSSGFTPSSYKKILLQDIVVRQYVSGVSDTAFMTQQDIDALVSLSQQSRSFYYITLSQQAAFDSIQIEDSEVQEFYNENQAQFMAPEQVSLEYIELSLTDLAETIEVTDELVKQQYEENLKNFNGDVLRQAAHILIESKDDGTEEAVIAEVQERILAGESFSELVSTFSDDLGSKDMGGDLGVTDGSTFPDAFEAALANLSVDEVSGPIYTDAGVHFIKLLSEQRAEAPTFEESADSIRHDIAMAEADALYVELLTALPDATYNSEDLEYSADELGLEAKTTDLFDREGGEGIAANNQVLALAFSDEVLNSGQVTDLVELGDDHVVVFRKREHIPSHVEDFEVVAEDIRAILRQQKARDILIAQAKELEAVLQSNNDIESLAQERNLDWQIALDVNRVNNGYPAELLGYLFSQTLAAETPTVGSVELSNGDYAVTLLTDIKPGKLPEMTPEQKLTLLKNISQQQGGVELSVFESQKRIKADVTFF